MTLSPIQDGSSSIPSNSFLQSRFWADFKSSFGWSSFRFQVTSDETVHHAVRGATTDSYSYELSVLIRKLVGPFTFAYIAHGPDTEFKKSLSQDHLAHLGSALKEWLPQSCLFIRFDPGWYCVGGEKDIPVRPEFTIPLIKASDVQPPDTVVLALSCTEDELLARMKPKWRYNIRLAEKKNVLITEESATALDIFYSLYQETAARDHIVVHPKGYYEKLFKLALLYRQAGHHLDGIQPLGDLSLGDLAGIPEKSKVGVQEEPVPVLRLWLARHDGQALACIVTLFYGTTATYLYGASSDEKRNLMPAYALQWAAIRAARAAGCLEYDMYGIPPTDDEHHPMAGLYRFKTGFGGELRHYPGAWDYVYLPVVYSLFRSVEKARLFWHKKLRKIRR